MGFGGNLKTKSNNSWNAKIRIFGNNKLLINNGEFDPGSG